MQQKRSRWVYIMLILMVLALLGFSGLPLISSIIEANQSGSQTQNQTVGISPEQQTQLEAEATGYQKVLEREPNNSNALRGLLEVRLKQKDIQGAIEPLEKLAQIHPEQREYSILLAQAKQQLQDYEGAAAAYRKILATYPGDIQALSGIVDLYLSQNQPQRAIGLLQDTLEQAKQNGDKPSESIDVVSVQLLLGEVYAQQKRYDEAIASYDRALEANKEDFRPILGKALVFQEQGKQDRAKPLFETAHSLAPSQFKDQIGQLASEQSPANSEQ
ncbi:tetratricopeptide repeat protein [Pleurocapsales cyanobacterium LEGE 06147]|nr:tetratricopeptide repeat protein [Pleurocapsales cyanobacterium LEGE 06147]